jgi:disulfide bond formation protein DsbB
MNGTSSLIFLGLLLVALAALFLLLFQIHTLMPDCQHCMEIRHIISPIWWVER